MPDLWLLLIPGLPLLAACWIAARLLLRWGRGDEAEYLTAYSVMGAGALSLLLIVVAAVQVSSWGRRSKCCYCLGCTVARITPTSASGWMA